MKVVFVRHTSVEVPGGTAYGRSDVPLRASFPLEASVTQTWATGRCSGLTK